MNFFFLYSNPSIALWISLLSLACFLHLVDSFSAYDSCNQFHHPHRISKTCLHFSLFVDHTNHNDDNEAWNEPPERPPIPSMPSDMFQDMARSQLELLANSLPGEPGAKKVESMALYLPQENVKTGQLEFAPVVVYPDPNTERVFIASDAGSGQAPTLPKTLTKLPGFSHATTLLPGYPMLTTSGDEVKPGVGVVEEVLCDVRFKNKAAALSVPLLSGSQTVGVLLVSPAATSSKKKGGGGWTKLDREQVSRAAQSLSMALSMDNERNFLREQNNAFRDGLSDSLHQVKNPLQALRTYGKILQRQIVDTDGSVSGKSTPLPELVERLMVQSERVVDLMVPMDSLVHALEEKSSQPSLMPATNDTTTTTSTAIATATAADISATHPTGKESLVKWNNTPKALPWENETIEFARLNGTTVDLQEETQETSVSYEFGSSNATTADMVFRRQPSSSSSSEVTTTTEDVVVHHRAPAGPRTINTHHNHHHTATSTTSSTSTSTSTTVVGGSSEMEMTFIADVLDPIFSAYEAIAAERGIRFEILQDSNELPGVMAAPRSVQEAVSNVLDNAFKYVILPKPGSPFIKNPSPLVRVRLLDNFDHANSSIGPSPVASSSAGVTLLVEDNGPGIHREERESIFRRGYRSDETNSVEGTGLGLDISRSLMDRMSGTLSVVDPVEECSDCLDGAVLKFELFRKPR